MDAMMIMHPDDAKAIEVLRSIKGFDKVARAAMDYGYERLYRGENLGEMVQVNSENFPQVYYPFLEVVKAVGIDEPEIFIYNDPIMNAFTYGDNNPFIAISSSMVEKMSRDELKCVIAHECGHIICHHTLYLTILAILENLGFALQIVSEALLLPLLAGLRYWRRCGELSADRCAAAVVGEKVFQMQMLKLTCGLGEVHGSPYQLVEQAREYESMQNASWWNRIQQEMRIMFYTHPQMCHRALEIDRWKKSWQYRQLIAEPQREVAL